MFDNISRYTQDDIDTLLTRTLGERYADYRRRWCGASPQSPPTFPIHIDFELNDICNQRCSMCPRNDANHPAVKYRLNTKAVLDFSVFKKVIDEGAGKGLLSINVGAFAEPLLNPDVFRMVSYAHQHGIVDSRLITNGLLLDRFMEQIFDSNLVNLFVSIDAFTENTYRQIRGSGFRRVTENLQAFLEEKKARKSLLPIVRVSFVDMQANRGEKGDFIAYWRSRVDIIDVQVFDNFNADVTRPVDRSAKRKWDCTAPWARVAVLSNGNILPCCNFFGINIPIGNIHEYTIQQAWESKAMQRVRQGIAEDSLDNCSVCQRTGE